MTKEEVKPLELVGAAWIAERLGTTQQNISLAGKRALKPGYRGDMVRPDAVNEGRPLWIKEKAEKWISERKGRGK